MTGRALPLGCLPCSELIHSTTLQAVTRLKTYNENVNSVLGFYTDVMAKVRKTVLCVSLISNAVQSKGRKAVLLAVGSQLIAITCLEVQLVCTPCQPSLLCAPSTQLNSQTVGAVQIENDATCLPSAARDSWPEIPILNASRLLPKNVLLQINGTQSMDAVFRDIMKALDAKAASMVSVHHLSSCMLGLLTQ